MDLAPADLHPTALSRAIEESHRLRLRGAPSASAEQVAAETSGLGGGHEPEFPSVSVCKMSSIFMRYSEKDPERRDV